MKVLAACATFPAPVAQISNLLYRRASSLQSVADRARSTVLTLYRLEIGATLAASLPLRAFALKSKELMEWFRLRPDDSVQGRMDLARQGCPIQPKPGTSNHETHETHERRDGSEEGGVLPLGEWP